MPRARVRALAEFHKNFVRGTTSGNHKNSARLDAMPWKAKPVSILQRENDNLKTTICLLRRELENRQGAVGRLELLVHERTARIDELTGKLEQARAAEPALGCGVRAPNGDDGGDDTGGAHHLRGPVLGIACAGALGLWRHDPMSYLERIKERNLVDGKLTARRLDPVETLCTELPPCLRGERDLEGIGALGDQPARYEANSVILVIVGAVPLRGREVWSRYRYQMYPIRFVVGNGLHVRQPDLKRVRVCGGQQPVHRLQPANGTKDDALE